MICDKSKMVLIVNFRMDLVFTLITEDNYFIPTKESFSLHRHTTNSLHLFYNQLIHSHLLLSLELTFQVKRRKYQYNRCFTG